MNTADFIQRDLSRRQFLGRSAQNAASMAAGMVAISSTASAAARNEKVRLAVIGVRNQGRALAAQFGEFSDVDVAVLCDVDRNLEPAAIKAVVDVCGQAPRWESDFRRVLDDRSIDAVVIATPDHWHAPMGEMACEAGKDVYIESPVGHTIQEGAQLLAAARSHQRIMQTGLQQRSGSHFQSAVEHVRSGKIGDVRIAKAWLATVRKPLGRRRDEIVPPGVDYDLWLGPAPARSFCSNRFHFNWHWFWDYGSGELGNWGVHLLDVARWGLGVELPVSVSSAGGKYVFRDEQETPDTLMVNYRYPEHTITWEHRLWSNHGVEGRGSGVSFHGERGTLVVDRSGWKIYDSKERLTADSSDLMKPHLRDFVNSIRTRQKPAADIEIGHISTTLCHLGNMSYRLGREIRLDATQLNFGDDAPANALLSKDYRAPWQPSNYRTAKPSDDLTA